jgi:transcription initiation factor TFIIE subunit alpha
VKQEVDDPDAAGVKTEASDAKSATEDLASVFAQIEAERRRKEQEEEDDEEEEDDDEDEFEDVAVSTPSAVPDAKRVKLDTSAAPTPAASTGDGGDVSEEDEFEDVN